MKRLWMATTLVFLVARTAAFADTYQIRWASINSGGGVATSSVYTMNGTVGQAAVGMSTNTSFIHWAGFWAGEIPTPTPAASPAAVKMLPDGTFVSTAGKIVTASLADFTNFFYIEQVDRSSGIRVAAPASAVSGLDRGSVVNVIGTISTLDSGERQISGPLVIIAGSRAPLTPLGMPNRSLGGSDTNGQFGVIGGFGVNTIGLLIRTWGRVTSSTAQALLIDDGSGTPVTVDATCLVSPPGVGSYISVAGISGLPASGDRTRLITPRNGSDVIIHQP